jgi:hypothetical protein
MPGFSAMRPVNAATLILVIAAGWAAVNGAWFAADAARRYRAEAAWFVLAGVLLVAAGYAITRLQRRVVTVESNHARLFAIALAAFLAGSAILYLPMFSIGLLSDDFVLLSRAESGSLFDRSWEFLRPLPLALWRMAKAPVALHALNIALHAVNAWLTMMLAMRVGLSKTAAVLSAILFLVFPTSVEAVAWAAGVFDVMLVTFVLIACVALTTMSPGIKRTAAIAALTAAALATKETGVVTPAILVLSCLAASGDLRHIKAPMAASIGIVAAYVLIRMAAGFSTAPPADDASGYMLKEILSRPFATLGLPFHHELLRSHRWIPYVFALLWPLLFLLSALQWRTDRATAIRVFSCAAWVLASVLPLATMLFIANDLQGSRYVYLGSVAFSIMVLSLVANLDQSVQMLVAISLIALFAVSTRSHQSAWTDAALERDRVLSAYRSAGLDCDPADVRGLPDHVRGAYVFRNGFNEAVRGVAANGTPQCVVTWDCSRFVVGR